LQIRLRKVCRAKRFQSPLKCTRSRCRMLSRLVHSRKNKKCIPMNAWTASDTGIMPSSIYRVGRSQQSPSRKNLDYTVCKTSYGWRFYIKSLLMVVLFFRKLLQECSRKPVELVCSRISLCQNCERMVLWYGILACRLPKGGILISHDSKSSSSCTSCMFASGILDHVAIHDSLSLENSRVIQEKW
jgi:hypothetical protein